MVNEKSNQELLEQFKNNPDYTLIKKEKLGRSFGVLKGIILYVFLNKDNKEVIYLGDKMTKEQLPIFNILLKQGISQTHTDFTMERTVTYNG